MISLAHFPEDREDIIRLWSDCFGDARHYIEFFLDNLPSENVLFVYKNEGNIAGMFFLMPAKLRYIIDNKQCDEFAYYVYAVGVDTEHRNLGIAGEMLEFAKAYAYERGAELFLVPASRMLVTYYAKRGFTLSGGTDKVLQAAECKGFEEGVSAENVVTLSNIDNKKAFDRFVEMMYRKREAVLQSECALLWSLDNFKFAIKEHIYTGGLVYIALADNSCDLEYIVGKQSAEGFYTREALLNGRIYGNIDFEIMLTTMNCGKNFIEASEKVDGAYINFCFN